MVIWSGGGWLGFVFMVGCLIGGEWLTDHLLGDGYFRGRLWPKLAAWLLCSLLCWITGRPLNRHLPRRIFDVPARLSSETTRTGEPCGHTLAFVRLEYGGLVAAPLYLYVALEQAGLV